MPGVEWLEAWQSLPPEQRRVHVPTTSDPRGTDFSAAERLRQSQWMVDLERRAIVAFEGFGVLMANTCVNYQTIMPPILGEHVADGDTGAVAYSNSVLGARSNFEGGPSALSAALTGRTPRYGYHLSERRRATIVVRVTWTPRQLHEWGALGAIVGKLAADYSQVPALIGIDRVPTSDELKHFSAAVASFGSVAIFHIVGITPEAGRLEDVVAPDFRYGPDVGLRDIDAFQAQLLNGLNSIDVIVFSAPQLSIFEMQQAAGMLDGRHVTIPLLVVTGPQVKADADRLGSPRASNGRAAPS